VLVERVASLFPVEWADPADARLSWERDLAFSDPVTALTGSLLYLLDEALATEDGIPIRHRTARVNTYVYRARGG
jgi:hypothetical protein